jgi:hypothetical protein
MNELREILKTGVRGLIFGAFALGAVVALAWTGPSSSPPNGNVAAPINISSTAQTKSGTLNVDTSANGTRAIQGISNSANLAGSFTGGDGVAGSSDAVNGYGVYGVASGSGGYGGEFSGPNGISVSGAGSINTTLATAGLGMSTNGNINTSGSITAAGSVSAGSAFLSSNGDTYMPWAAGAYGASDAYASQVFCRFNGVNCPAPPVTRSFGGAYGIGISGCSGGGYYGFVNSVTGTCGCPSGYSAQYMGPTLIYSSGSWQGYAANYICYQ